VIFKFGFRNCRGRCFWSNSQIPVYLWYFLRVRRAVDCWSGDPEESSNLRPRIPYFLHRQLTKHSLCPYCISLYPNQFRAEMGKIHQLPDSLLFHSPYNHNILCLRFFAQKLMERIPVKIDLKFRYEKPDPPPAPSLGRHEGQGIWNQSVLSRQVIIFRRKKYRIVSVYESFLAFQFCTMIEAVCYTFAAIASHTIYEHSGKKTLTDFISLFALQYPLEFLW